jgi:protein-L-isoaspartate(D-aspartate) O-methyltransferase
MDPADPFLAVRRRMVDEQLAARGIRDPRVLQAMERIGRHWFVPPPLKDLAYTDQALGIDCDQTISQPYIVGLMSEALALKGHERVLEIGTGSGYQTAVLCELARTVVSIERHEALAHQARRRLDALGYRNAELLVGDGSGPLPLADGTFQRILVAAAARRCPQSLIDVLAKGGILVIPLGSPRSQTLQRIEKRATGLVRETLSGCRFVPLVGAE